MRSCAVTITAPRLWKSLPVVAGLALALAGCSKDAATRVSLQPGKGPLREAERQLTTHVQTVSERDGVVLLELPVGSSSGVAAGDFFHISSADEADLLKGTVMVQEIVGPQLALARLVGGLLDRDRPLAPSDKATFIRDISRIYASTRLQEHLDAEQQAITAEINATDDAHAQLRLQYQQRLDRLRSLHEKELEAARARFADELAGREAAAERQRRRLATAHAAELAALQASLGSEAKEALKQAAAELQAKLADSRQQNRKLTLQIDGLLQEQQRAAQLQQETQARHQRQITELRRELTAETETRSILEKRLQELQARLDGQPSVPAAILSHDPQRAETVLEGLQRLRGENTQLREQLADRQQALQAVEARRLQLAERVRELQERLGDGDEHSVAATRVALESTQRDLLAAQLMQLRTERAYYDLARRILALPGEVPAIVHLQERLRTALDQAYQAVEQPRDQNGANKEL